MQQYNPRTECFGLASGSGAARSPLPGRGARLQAGGAWDPEPAQDLQKDLLSSSCFPNSHETTSCLGEQRGQALLSGADLPIARRPGLLFQTLFS